MLQGTQDPLVVFALLTLVTGVALSRRRDWIFAQLAVPRAGDRAASSSGTARRSDRSCSASRSRSPQYFWGRPSATGPFPNNGAVSSGSNQGATNPNLANAVPDRIAALRAADPGNTRPVPVDLVTASGSGLDPHISPAAAEYQVARVARARGVDAARVRALVAGATEGPHLRLARRAARECAAIESRARCAGHAGEVARWPKQRPDPDQLLAARSGRGGQGAARAAAHFLRRDRRRRQDLRDARSRARGARQRHRRRHRLRRAAWPRRNRAADGGPRTTADAAGEVPRHRRARNSISTRRWRGIPAILIVDELAHSNLVGGEPPPRHPKRWQDIEELLEAGIDVWTTVNVQHLESLNDVVAQITGVRQRETLPDRVFDEADEVELIDLPPDDLDVAPDDDRAAPRDHVHDDAGDQRPPRRVEQRLVTELVEHEHEHEGDQRGARAGPADARPGARVRGDRDDHGLRRTAPRARPSPCPSSCSQQALRRPQGQDLTVADVAHEPVLVGAGRRRPCRMPL